MSNAVGITTTVIPARRADEQGLVDMQLTPAADFKPSDGRAMSVPAWRIDAAIAAKVIARFQKRRSLPVVDYEHQTLLTATNGQPAPAAGWINALEWREGSGLWARVRLTERAAAHVAAGEYRYVSPVFAFDVKTGEVLGILHAALTNNPAIDGMAALASRAALSFGFDDAVTDGGNDLTAAEAEICRKTGVTPEDFIAIRDQLAAGEQDPQLTADEHAIVRATGVNPALYLQAKQRSAT